jgi:hypothetical protein
MRMFALASICLLALVVGIHLPCGRADTGRSSGGVSMRVLWVVLDYKRLPDAAWSEEQARSMLFKPLDMGESSITFDGRTCDGLTFESEEIDLAEYVSKLHPEAPALLKVEGQRAILVRTQCDIPGFAEFVRLEDRQLLIHNGGVFFFLKPNVTR